MIFRLRAHFEMASKKSKSRSTKGNADDDSMDEEYEVEDIVDKNVAGGKVHYLVKWKGYPSSQNTWEPEAHLNHLPNLVKKFEEAYATKLKSKLHPTSKKIKKDDAEDKPTPKRVGRPPKSPKKEEVTAKAVEKRKAKGKGTAKNASAKPAPKKSAGGRGRGKAKTIEEDVEEEEEEEENEEEEEDVEEEVEEKEEVKKPAKGKESSKGTSKAAAGLKPVGDNYGILGIDVPKEITDHKVLENHVIGSGKPRKYLFLKIEWYPTHRGQKLESTWETPRVLKEHCPKLVADYYEKFIDLNAIAK